jgi:hypothetical protein
VTNSLARDQPSGPAELDAVEAFLMPLVNAILSGSDNVGPHRHKRRRLAFRRNLPPPAIQKARVDPSLRTISVTTAPGSFIAATSRAFCDELQRRRRSIDVITSARSMTT